MSSGYSDTPLLKKLGIKPGYTIMPVNEPDHYLDLLGELPEEVKIVQQRYDQPVDMIHFFAPDREILVKTFPKLKPKIRRDGMLWVSWIKGASSLKTDINGSDVRGAGLDLGLVDIKVCAVDEDWSGLKFMYRKEDR